MYYRRVEKANRLFTNYKEGWKTDRGYCYIMFGPPFAILPSHIPYKKPSSNKRDQRIHVKPKKQMRNSNKPTIHVKSKKRMHNSNKSYINVEHRKWMYYSNNPYSYFFIHFLQLQPLASENYPFSFNHFILRWVFSFTSKQVSLLYVKRWGQLLPERLWPLIKEQQQLWRSGGILDQKLYEFYYTRNNDIYG